MNYLHRLRHLLMFVWLFPIWNILVRQCNHYWLRDMERWIKWKMCPYTTHYMQFVFLMTDYQEFRNICYYRMGKARYLVQWMCPPMDTLYIRCPNIGGGLLIQHGFATIIQAEKIGCNAKIFQQVTIGYNEDKRPIIGDNVEICCGAKVIGGVHVGNNVTIGAQALVIKDVEDNVVVGGVPAHILKRKEIVSY